MILVQTSQTDGRVERDRYRTCQSGAEKAVEKSHGSRENDGDPIPGAYSPLREPAGRSCGAARTGSNSRTSYSAIPDEWNGSSRTISHISSTESPRARIIPPVGTRQSRRAAQREA